LKENVNPETGAVKGSWLIWVPISEFRGEKLCSAELLK
jgi:hypothetical protein